MDLVVDANILFAALIKESISSSLLYSTRFNLYAPEYILFEIEKHQKEILDKSKRSLDEFYDLLNFFRRKLILVPLEELEPYLEKAKEISPDPYDIAYVALALKLKCSIWSNDKELKKQNVILVYHTHELLRL